jgi:hypothetical protein
MLTEFIHVFWQTLKDVAPVVGLFVFFQFIVLKQAVPQPRKVVLGIILVILGLTLFLMGLEKALFPVGQIMAKQLSSPDFLEASYHDPESWLAYYWIYIFAAVIGFSTSIAEPSLIAVAMKAHEISGGAISQRGLRLTVACGVAIAMILSTFRIVSGTPLYVFILISYFLVLVLTIFAPRHLIALAYDVGGVTTSTVTVPIVAALGLGLSSMVPGRNPATDGFGMVALACLFPVIAVLAYGTFTELYITLQKRKHHEV